MIKNISFIELLDMEDEKTIYITLMRTLCGG